MSEYPSAFADGPGGLLEAYFERLSAPRPLRARARSEWQARRQVVRQAVRESLGIEPTPAISLQPSRSGVLETNGCRIERWHWQSWPGVYGSGWLYLPDDLETPAPAILNPHGHFEDGALHPDVQTRCLALARLGYLALAVDSVHLRDDALGVNPAGVMTWNNLRALDFLCGRPEVDRQRLGATGASGGGQQVMYLMCLDNRLRVAAPALLVSYFRRILMAEGKHCHCNHVPGLLRHADEPEICSVFAPRPALYLSLSTDWTSRFPEAELLEIRSVYRLLGAENRLAHQQFDGPHAFSKPLRELVYAWFNRWLRDDDDPEAAREPDVRPLPAAQLRALDSPPPTHRGWEAVVAYYRAQAAPPPRLSSRDSRKRYQQESRARLADLLGGLPSPVAPEVQEHDAGEGDGFRWRLLSYRSEPDVRVPALYLQPPGDAPGPTALLLHPEGKAGWGGSAQPHPLAEALLTAGWALLLPDVRLRGEMRREWRLNCTLWGRPEAGMAVTDALAALDWLHGLPEVNPGKLLVLGMGDLGVAALAVGALDARLSAVVADCCQTTYRDGGEGLPPLPNVLRAMDVAQLAALSAPRRLWLYNVPAGRVGFSSRRYFDWTRRTYQSLRAAEALRMETGALDAAGLSAWA